MVRDTSGASRGADRDPEWQNDKARSLQAGDLGVSNSTSNSSHVGP